MRFSVINKLLQESADFKELYKAAVNSRNCQVHGLSDSQKAYVSYCLFESLNREMLIITQNEIEARNLYEDIRTFTKQCFLFPTREMVFNIDATSGEIKSERLNTLREILKGDKIIVIASVDALAYKMPPPSAFQGRGAVVKTGNELDLMSMAAELIEYGYERVDIVEGKGQFSQRGGIIDVFPILESQPYRIELFGDEVDTIRIFDIMTQRSEGEVKEIEITPAREMILSAEDIQRVVSEILSELDRSRESFGKKNKEELKRLEEKALYNVEKLKNFRHFDGIESFITYIYKEPSGLIDYFKNPLVIIDESGRVAQRTQNMYSEYTELFKAVLERGEALPGQANYAFTTEEILYSINASDWVALNMLPRTVEQFKPRELVNFNAVTMNPLSGNIEYLYDEIKLRVKKNNYIIILAGTSARAQRLVEALKEEEVEAYYRDEITDINKGHVYVTYGSLSKGMEFPDIKLSIISDRDVFKDKKEKKKVFTKKGSRLQSFTDLKAGDFVVHANHGIGMFKGIKELLIEGIKKDYLVLQYHGGDTLYVPVEQLDMVQKYIGGNDNPPKVYKLGGSDWAKTKKKVKESLKEMAEDLVKLYAERSTLKGYSFKKDTQWQYQFEEEFPYQETPDQISAIREIKGDMEDEKPMDRLLCGDVGYGKTEVAIRAAFKAVMDGKQVAVLVPTTILAEQHFNNFKQRFSDFPVNIEMLSRFRSAAQQKRTIQDLNSGNVDVVIGTHKLLQKSIKFKDLGLLIIDEEQRFGVSHKEKIKALKKNIDVLTLTATPIPRTLHMSMIGVRDMSVIETPPEERYPVQTYVLEYNDGIIRDAIIREVSRGGQVFFVYNRVETIKDMQLELSRLVPEARTVIAHGQMPEKELEEVILDFIKGEGDILLCTTIIETGIDMPNVNTLIVYDADRMGLSQLYQLRGRVGRSTRLAYSYFTYRRDKVLTEVAEKRLKAIREFTEFGSGFKIAMRDLEIRGAGNLLGTEQHGHMAAVGYDLYCRLLEEAVLEIRGTAKEESVDTTIDLTVNAYIPDDFISDEVIKIEIYKKIAAIENDEDMVDVQEEITDRFGDMPKQLENLINIAHLKTIAKKHKIVSIKQNDKVLIIQFTDRNMIPYELFRKLYEKYKNSLSYASNMLPSLRLVMKSLGSDEVIDRLTEFLVMLDSLHNSEK